MIKYLLICDVCKREVDQAGSVRMDSLVIGDACMQCLREGIMLTATYANPDDQTPSGYVMMAAE